VPESTTKSAPPPSQPAPAEKTTATTQPPLHPFTNVKETSYQPPHERNFAATPANPAKDKEPAYHYVAPIQNLCTVIDVYNKLMQAPLVTLSPEELFAISTEVHNRLRKAIMPKRVLSETVSTHALIEQAPDDEKPPLLFLMFTRLTLIVWLQENDPYPSMLLKSCIPCGQLQWLSTTERRWKVSLIQDPRL
jgi:hypothetical protein